MASSRQRVWLHILGFPIVTVIVYVILDVEYPRMGTFRLDVVDQVLLKVRQGMN